MLLYPEKTYLVLTGDLKIIFSSDLMVFSTSDG